MITTKTGTYFESKAKREGVTEDGTQAKITELYVVNSMSFTECEAKVSEYLAQLSQGEYEVLTETKAKYKEIFLSDADEDDIFYKVRVAFLTLDEHSGKERKTRVDYLVQADSVEKAKRHTDEVLNGSMDFVIQSIGETNIVDIID